MAIQAAQVYSKDNIGLGFGSNPLLGGGSSQELIMDNACCGVGVNGFNQFYSNMQQQQQMLLLQQQQQQHSQLQHQQQRNQNFDSMPLSQSIALQAERQTQEIDYYIRSQNERLRLVLQEQRKQQFEILLKRIEIKSSALLRQKDEEIAKARNRTMELEIFLKNLEMERQSWQRIAQENESLVYSLNNSLEQLKEKASSCLFNNGAEDAESCCDVDDAKERNRAIAIGFGESNNREAQETEQEQRLRKMVMVCKGCNSRDSCFLFLPCRHLCSCKSCEAFLGSCPLCLTPKKASIEALIF